MGPLNKVPTVVKIVSKNETIYLVKSFEELSEVMWMKSRKKFRFIIFLVEYEILNHPSQIEHEKVLLLKSLIHL